MKTIILPGMGANSNMYPKEKYNKLQDVIFANWPKYDGELSVEEVAKKVIDIHQINNEMVAGGSSLGGMVAIEIAKIVGITKVILIGSATNSDYINPLLQKLSGLAEITPVKIIQVLTGKVNQYASNEPLSMFEESDSNFIKAMCKALFKWEGLGKFNCDVCQIHGEKDLVIFPPKNNVKIILGGGHLISITHAEEVANFINKNKH
jgi:pimeloyl-ACP methyl ester carboxylesterase